ncbi:MAG: KpsF/GutQ family sugar-phosphate isomerase [Gemmatimonadota bacterium]
MPESAVAAGRRVLRLESREIARAAERLGEEFSRAVDLLARANGRVIVSGVGKSGLIARKIAATLTSTGTPATYLHPVDSLHGDLGMVGKDDIAIVLSKSGESQELFGMLGSLQRMKVPVIAITGGGESQLAKIASVTLDGGVSEEACPHDLAPTASTTVALALGDALAVALLERKGFAREDFALLHPGGSLGVKLTLLVRDVMLTDTGSLSPQGTMRDAVVVLAHHRGIASVVEDGRLVGVITAGDLTRQVEKGPDFLDRPVEQVMTRSPCTAAPDELAASAVGTMERNGIMALPVIDEHSRLAGVVHLHDLLRAGAV